MIYGYARVSTKEQNLDRQLNELNFCDKVLCEKESGKNFQRPIYQKLKKKLKKGDLLVLLSLDRLGRNYEQIINEWKDITNKGCDIQVLDMPILNTKNGVNGLDGTFISNLVLQILAYVSEKERLKIKERQRQGIDAAMQKGVVFGRRRIIVDNSQFIKDVKVGLTEEEMMKKYNISRGSYYRYKKEYGLTDTNYKPKIKTYNDYLKELPEYTELLLERYNKGKISQKQALKHIGVSKTILTKLMKGYREKYDTIYTKKRRKNIKE